MRDRAEVEALLRPRFAESRAFCGFWPADGWLDLIVEIHERLLDNPDYRIGQVKEKFGGLRFYCDGLTEAEMEFVAEKEAESYTICQQCGSREGVEMRNRGWYATLCDACDGDEASRGYHHE